MIGFAVNLALFAVDQAPSHAMDNMQVQPVKVVHGFVQDRATNIYGFAHDRAEEVLGMLGHAAETAKACTVQSVQKVKDFAQGGAQAILGMVEHATKTVKAWMVEGASLLELLWKLYWRVVREEYHSWLGNRDSFTITMNKINSNIRTMMAWWLLARMESILARLR